MPSSLPKCLLRGLAATALLVGTLPQPQPLAATPPPGYLQTQARLLGVSLRPADVEVIRSAMRTARAQTEPLRRERHLVLSMAERLGRQTPQERALTLQRAQADARQALRRRHCAGEPEALAWVARFPQLAGDCPPR